VCSICVGSGIHHAKSSALHTNIHLLSVKFGDMVSGISCLQGANRPVWLCDDIFAAVDVHTAALLLDTLQGPLVADKTRIVATRHPPCIAAADMVVTLDAGAIQCIGANVPKFCTLHLTRF
jgi:ABC-type transport system involved in cytochrome bd biosynthesis fused ATPase/permease subunit